jgi:hypothetical protein
VTLNIAFICLTALLIAAGVTRAKNQRTKIMSAASDRLTASLAALTTSVEALVAKLSVPPPADDTAAETAAADAADALTAKVNAALNPPTA